MKFKFIKITPIPKSFLSFKVTREFGIAKLPIVRIIGTVRIDFFGSIINNISLHLV